MISREEYEADRTVSARRSFSEVDTNGDGSLSYQEVVAAFVGARRGRGGTGDD